MDSVKRLQPKIYKEKYYIFFCSERTVYTDFGLSKAINCIREKHQTISMLLRYNADPRMGNSTCAMMRLSITNIEIWWV